MLAGIPKPFAPKKQSEFKRHIETREAGVAVERNARNIVHAIPAFLDKTLDFGQSWLGSIINLQSGAGYKTKVVNRKNDGVEDGFVSTIERAVDEDVIPANRARRQSVPRRN